MNRVRFLGTMSCEVEYKHHQRDYAPCIDGQMYAPLPTESIASALAKIPQFKVRFAELKSNPISLFATTERSVDLDHVRTLLNPRHSVGINREIIIGFRVDPDFHHLYTGRACDFTIAYVEMSGHVYSLSRDVGPMECC